MNIKAFLNQIKKLISQTPKNTKIGNYIYIGINRHQSFGSPGGGSWADTPAFEFHNGDFKYLIRIIPTSDKIVIEAIHLSTMLINYTLNESNFFEEGGQIKLIENYVMTVVTRKSNAEVKEALIKAGMPNDIIFLQNPKKLDAGTFINSVLTWAKYREKAKEMLRTNPTSAINPKALKELKSQSPLNGVNQIIYGPPVSFPIVRP